MKKIKNCIVKISASYIFYNKANIKIYEEKKIYYYRSRRHIYNIFNEITVDIDTILQIGKSFTSISRKKYLK
ncbi:MAG: hypothetical protein A2X01_16950 [Bacteroidetes bacterium GWF2_35_48]|nr:MAG: hypothetical protein A2X01_16950 [Bacteroidetes bacterium GWF2_35_48]